MPSDNAPDIKYTAEHEWVRVIADGPEQAPVLRLGITAFAAEALGDIVFVTLPEVGRALTAGQALGEVESTKSVSDIYAPVDGAVTRVNDQLDSTPELLNSDPLGEGWLVEIRPTAGAEQAFRSESLLGEDAYQALTKT